VADLEEVARVMVRFEVVSVDASHPFIVTVHWQIFVNERMTKEGTMAMDARDRLELNAVLLESMLGDGDPSIQSTVSTSLH
jgi:hypothetical protein